MLLTWETIKPIFSFSGAVGTALRFHWIEIYPDENQVKSGNLSYRCEEHFRPLKRSKWKAFMTSLKANIVFQILSIWKISFRVTAEPPPTTRTNDPRLFQGNSWQSFSNLEATPCSLALTLHRLSLGFQRDVAGLTHCSSLPGRLSCPLVQICLTKHPWPLTSGFFHLHSTCYDMNVYVHPKFTCWNPTHHGPLAGD